VSRIRQSVRALAVASLCTAFLATAWTPAHAAGLSSVSNTDPQRLVQSTGNLYWTNNVLNQVGTSFSSVYRTSKSATPGQETVLYRELHNGRRYFGALTYANVGGVFYGYVAVNDTSNSTSVIKRFPLAGGAATTIVTSPGFIGTRDLVNDGTSLFWADAGGLRSAPISGGAAQTRVSTNTIAWLALDATRVFFTSGSTVRSVPKTGVPVVTTQVSAPTTVTALHVRTSGTPTLYWGLRNDELKSRPLSSTVVTTWQAAAPGRQVTSVSSDGTRLLWTTCSLTLDACSVVKRSGFSTVVVATERVDARDVQGDATAMFWGDARVNRYTH